MKNNFFVCFTWILVGFGVLFLLKHLSVPFREQSEARNPKAFNYASLAEVPVLANGRVQPFDSLARNSLLLLRGKTSLRHAAGGGEEVATLSATAWLAELVLHGAESDKRPVFRIDNNQVLGELKLRRADGFDKKYFSFEQIRGGLGKLEEQARLAGSAKQNDRDAYQQAILKLYRAVQHYTQLKMTLLPIGFSGEANVFLDGFEKSREAARANPSGNFRDDPVFLAFLDNFSAFLEPARFGVFAVAPLAYPLDVPMAPVEQKKSWLKSGEVLAGVEPVTASGPVPEDVQAKVLRGRVAQVMDTKGFDPAEVAWFKLSDAFRAGQQEDFNKTLADLRTHLDTMIDPSRTSRVSFEEFINRFEPFYVATVLYALILVAVAFGWLGESKAMLNGAYTLLVVTFLLHSFALGSRMWIQERPPVTNLYSSAIFIGCAVCLMTLVMETFYRRGFASMVAAIVGFTTLIIAHNLGNDGDTLEMMRAVLDSNFWLTVHVITVTLGYAATFLAGFIAFVYVFMGLLTRALDESVSKVLQGMVYGVLCFALLFSFIGTVTGGIWADDSWGRFWGWDPKENGAVMIVLWNALVLHARWGGIARRRGLMALALGGNIITAWSWFGTNMLGIGLHSYGFMDAAFIALSAFCISQVGLIGLTCLPSRIWASPAAAGLKEKDASETSAKLAPSKALPEAL